MPLPVPWRPLQRHVDPVCPLSELLKFWIPNKVNAETRHTVTDVDVMVTALKTINGKQVPWATIERRVQERRDIER